MDTKTCSSCGESKSLESFPKRKDSPDGRRGTCRRCRSDYVNARRNEIKEHNKSRTIEEIRETVPKAKCTKCKQTKPSTEFNRCNIKVSGLQEKCRDCDNSWTKTWSKENSEYRSVYHADWYEINKEDKKRKNREWFRLNPGKQVQYDHKRRSRVYDAFVEEVSYEVLRERDGDGCFVCGQKIDFTLVYPDPMYRTLEHIVPLSKGGEHSYNNTALSHLVCNQRKNAKIVDKNKKEDIS